MTASGQEDQFPSPSLSGRCRLGEATFAGMGRKAKDAPIPDLPGLALKRGKFDPNRSFTIP
jgi:hypothetical protein